MKSIVQAAVLSIAIALPAALAVPASAQIRLTPGFTNPKIVMAKNEKNEIGYWTTTFGVDPVKTMNQDRLALRDRMMKRRVLEEYAEFLSPLRMPHLLRVFASDCKGGEWDSPYYMSQVNLINMCYSYIAAAEKEADYLAKNQARLKLWTPVSRDQLVAGLFTSTLLHETGHALFDLMDVPVFGREEDAADQMAAFVALQFGKETARTVIKGFAYDWAFDAFISKADPTTVRPDPKAPNYPTDPDQQCRLDPFCAYSDTHGTASQRMYNTLCMAYGGDPATFKDFVDARWLPADRANGCAAEFQRVRIAFRKTILPFIDPVQMEKVKARTWFQAQEMKERQ